MSLIVKIQKDETCLLCPTNPDKFNENQLWPLRSFAGNIIIEKFARWADKSLTLIGYLNDFLG